MAMTATQQLEAYRFFAVAFDAAPGVTYMSQLAEAYAAGMTTEEIVETYTTKAEFLAIYPNFLTNNQFATRLVNNVVDSSATDAAKAAAIADIEAALAAGWSQGKVIYTIFSNLAAKDPADETWGATATLMANQVAVAKYYTEEQLGNATSVTALQSVISAVTASSDVSSNTAIAAVITAGVDPVVTAGQTFTLTTSVDAVSGGAGDDVISGVLGTSATYSVGDNIIGGAGTDTLRLINSSATDGAGGLVSVDGVENISIRMLGTAANALTMNAADWSGVTTIDNASSVAGSLLQVSGVAVGVNFAVYGDTDLNVDYAGLTTATDTASITLIGAGSGSASTALSYSDVNLDLDGSGFLDAAALNVSGNTYVNLNGGDDLRSITISGSASYLVLKTTASEVINTIDASQLAGTNKFFVSGRNDLSIVGGAGNDTFVFGTSLGASDSIVGNGGTDTISATLNNSTVRLNATGVEVASITLGDAAGGSLDLSAAQSITAITVGASAAGNVGSIVSFAGGTANLAGDNIGDISIDTIANATLAVVIGCASSTVSIASAAVTDAASLTISTTGSGIQAITTVFDVDTDVKTLAIVTNGSAHLSMADLNASGATSVTITTQASASAAFTDLDVGTGIANFVVNAGGSNGGDVTIGGVLFDGTSSLPDVVTVIASTAADVSIAEMQLGTAAASGAVQTVVLTLNAGNGSTVDDGSDGIDLNVDLGSATINLIAGQSGTVSVGTADMGDISAPGTGVSAGNVSLNISADVGQDGLVSIASISADDADINFGAITVGASGGLIIGSAAAGITMTTATASFGTITVGAAATASLGAIALAGSGGKVTGLSFVGHTGAGVTVSTLGGSGIGGITLNLGQSATATFGDITATTVGEINVTLADGATATFDDLEVTGAAATIGAITVTVGSGAEFAMGSAGSAGAAAGFASIAGYTVTVGNSGSADFGTIATTAAGRVGDITLNVSGGGDIDWGAIAASAVGTITVSGSGSITFSTVTAASVGGIDLRNQGSGGDFTIDMSGVTNGVVVDGGRGTSTITSGDGNDEFYFKTGLGTDRIIYSATGQASDTVYRFEAGTADDTIYIASTAFDLVDGAGEVIALAGGNGIANATAAVFSTISGTAAAATAHGAGESIIVVTYAGFANFAAVLADIGSGGQAEITLASAQNDANYLIAWTDGTDSYLTLYSGSADMGGANATFDDDAAAGMYQNLVSLVGVTAGALTVDNFKFFGIA